MRSPELAPAVLLLCLAAPVAAQAEPRVAPATVSGWVDLLRSGRAADMERATEALMEEGRRAEAPLLAALQDPQLPAPAAVRAYEILFAVEAPGLLDALLVAARHRQAERRKAAAEYLTNFRADDRARRALVLLVQDGDPRVVVDAVASAGGLDEAWSAILDSVVVPGLRDGSDSLAVDEGLISLRLTLMRHATLDRVVALLRTCAELEDPAAQLRLLSVITEGQVPVAAPFLRRILVGPPTEEEDEAERSMEELDGLRAADDLFQDDALLRLAVAPGVRAAAIRGLLRAKAPDGPALSRRLLRDRDPGVRAAALSVLVIPPGPYSLEREQTLDALVVLLTDPDRELRKTAHKALMMVTKQDLPLNAPRWVEWLQLERERMARGRELEALARDNGYESLDAFLADYPEFAPQPEEHQEEQQ